MTPEVAAAVEEIQRAYAGHDVRVTEEAQGGAYVIVDDLNLGATYTPSKSWAGFEITFHYPRADVYPHFLRGDLTRSDGRGFGPGFSPTNWQGRSTYQVSRRSNRRDVLIDTAAVKLEKVLAWVRGQ